MRLIFNDATELQIQQASTRVDGALCIKIINQSADALRQMFEDESKTAKMTVKDGNKVVAVYERYSTYYGTETLSGGILEVHMFQKQQTPEAKAELLAAAVTVAQINAQDLPDDQALDVKAIYPEWTGNGKFYARGYKLLRNDTLYKCLQDHTSQPDWTPEAAPSLWAKVVTE